MNELLRHCITGHVKVHSSTGADWQIGGFNDALILVPRPRGFRRYIADADESQRLLDPEIQGRRYARLGDWIRVVYERGDQKLARSGVVTATNKASIVACLVSAVPKEWDGCP